jgi:hypothetical protein
MTYSSDCNAIRGFRRTFPHLAGLSDEMIRADFINREAAGYTISIEAVADYEAERFGEASMTPRIEGVPMLRRSTKRAGATKAVRAFFASLPVGTARKEAIAKAVDAGFAFYTCRTQWQAMRAA